MKTRREREARIQQRIVGGEMSGELLPSASSRPDLPLSPDLVRLYTNRSPLLMKSTCLTMFLISSRESGSVTKFLLLSATSVFSLHQSVKQQITRARRRSFR